MNTKDFFGFRVMITPIIIQVLFWIGVVVCEIGGLISIVVGATSTLAGGGMRVLAGVLLMILGPLFVRVECEILILAFKIYDSLKEIAKNTSGVVDAPA